LARVLALTGEMDGCTLWRVLMPFTELQRQGYPGIEWGPRNDDRLAAVVHKFEAVILPRLHWPLEERAKSERWFDALHRAGIAIIYEVDDDMFSDDFVKRIMWKELYTREYAEQRRECILFAIRSSDGVTVSSQRLATMVRQYTDKPVKVVPNFIDLRWFREIQKKAQRIIPGLTIGWAGSFRPSTDIDIMAEAWGRLARKHPEVKFVIQGRALDVVYENVPKEQIVQLEWLPIHKYPASLVNIDIGCCSLSDTKFNRAKTYIKAMEYAVSGAAVVASPTVYGQIVEDGVNGFIASTVDEWEAALTNLVEDYTLRHAMNKALLAKVKKYHSLETQAWRWLEAWDEIIGEFRRRPRRKILLPHEVAYA
jgi:glycosyltransferase involved in cell wall biosynthesis